MGKNRSLKERYLYWTTFKWIVGIADFDKEAIFDPDRRLKIHWIKNTPKNSWFADPFILKVSNNHIYILVEELFYSNNKGRISKLIVNRHNWKLEQVIPVIDLSTHLSFPAYYRENGKVYIYPESTKTGKLTLYEYDENTGNAVPVKVLSNYPLADAVIMNYKERETILATTSPGDNGKVLDFYDCNDNSATPVSKIRFKTNVARNAGLPFIIDGRIIRPAQDCSKSYGSCVVLQEMIHKDNVLEFNEIKRFYSPLFNYREAFHTFNVFDNQMIAVDAEGFRFGIGAQIVYHIREFFRK